MKMIKIEVVHDLIFRMNGGMVSLSNPNCLSIHAAVKKAFGVSPGEGAFFSVLGCLVHPNQFNGDFLRKQIEESIWR